MARLTGDRLTKRGVLENTRRIGFSPGSIIDVGFAVGTEGLFDVFDGVRHLLIDPIAEAEPAMQAFCQAHPGSSYLVAAASDKVGEAPIVARDGITGSSFHTKMKQEFGKVRWVPTVKLDDVVAAQDLPGPYLLKLDVEGHEMHVLRGARERCLPRTELAILEISTWSEDHSKGRPSMMDLFRFMEDQGFVFYEFTEPGFRPVDGALYMFDAVFVRTDSVLRRQRSHRTTEQMQESYRAKAEKTAASLKAHG